jgi:hypothetical protein
VERLRTGQAVQAGRPGSLYRLGKWARRHRRTLVVAALLGALGMFAVDRLGRSSQARRAAEREAEIQRLATDREAQGRARLANLINFAIRQARPGGSLAGAQLASVLEQLELAVEAGHGLGAEEIIGLRISLASFWMADGQPERAAGLVDRNLEALTRAGQRQTRTGAECLRQAAVLAGLGGDLSSAEAYIAEARLCPGQGSQGENSLYDAIQDLEALAMAQMSALAPSKALDSLRAALFLADQVHGLPAEAVAALRFNRHLCELQTGQPELAEAGLRQLLPTSEALFGPHHPRRVDVLMVRAKALIELGRIPEGLALLVAEEPAARSAYAHNPGRLGGYLGALHAARYRSDPSLENFASLLAEQHKLAQELGPAHTVSLSGTLSIAELRLERGEVAAALTELEQALDACRSAFGREHVRSLELEGLRLVCQQRLSGLTAEQQQRLESILLDLARNCGERSERLRRLRRLALAPLAGD